MFVDAPGEWFVQWARVPNDATAEGARWVIRHSDVLLLMVDSHALADSAKLPEARRSIRDFIDRVAANVTYPVSVVWTKSDIPIPVTVEKNIADAIDQVLPNAHTVRTTTTTATSIEACFAWSIDAADSSQSLPFLAETKMSSDPFLSFRSEH